MTIFMSNTTTTETLEGSPVDVGDDDVLSCFVMCSYRSWFGLCWVQSRGCFESSDPSIQ